MKRGGIIWAGVFGGLALACSTPAIVNDAGNPYFGIVDRNPFGLKDPPPPAAETNTPAPPLNIKLTGITTILGGKRALFLVSDPPMPGQPAKPPQSYILREGQQEGQLEVLEIDDKAGIVKILNGGMAATLDITKDAPKLPGGPAAPPPGGVPSPAVFVPPPAPGAAPGSPAVTTFGGKGVSIGGGPAVNPSAAATRPTIPARTLRLPSTAAPAPTPTPTPTQATPQVPTPSIEEQIIMMEVERERNKNNPNFPPLPPTPVTPNPESLFPPAPQ